MTRWISQLYICDRSIKLRFRSRTLRADLKSTLARVRMQPCFAPLDPRFVRRADQQAKATSHLKLIVRCATSSAFGDISVRPGSPGVTCKSRSLPIISRIRWLRKSLFRSQREVGYIRRRIFAVPSEEFWSVFWCRLLRSMKNPTYFIYLSTPRTASNAFGGICNSLVLMYMKTHPRAAIDTKSVVKVTVLIS